MLKKGSLRTLRCFVVSGLLWSQKVYRMPPERRFRTSLFFAAAMSLFLTWDIAVGQVLVNKKNSAPDAFRQLDEVLPTANSYRTASGAPGHEYWQQKVDYDIDVELHDDTQRITGTEVILYVNNSPDTLRYLWLQLDANRFRPDSAANRHKGPSLSSRVEFKQLNSMLQAEQFPGGTKIISVTGSSNNRKLNHRTVGSNMRVDLPQPLVSGEQVGFKVRWEYRIPDATVIRARGGFERFEKDGNNVYEIAQWFPRLCAYSDAAGWQHKEFLGRGEFALEFGDYVVRLTVPSDHIVASTGQLQNPADVLSSDQRSRLKKARSAEEPVFIVTPEEALKNQKTQAKDKKTWSLRLRMCEILRLPVLESSSGMLWAITVAATRSWPCRTFRTKPNRCGANTQHMPSFTRWTFIPNTRSIIRIRSRSQ